MDLLSFELILKPLVSLKPGRRIPEWWGYAAKQLFLNHVDLVNPALAVELSVDEVEERSYTVSSLMGPEASKDGLYSRQRFQLRLTSLRQDLTTQLLQILAPGGSLAPGSEVELDRLPFQVVDVAPIPIQVPQITNSNSRSGLTTYQELSDVIMFGTDQASWINIAFCSPTSFKKSGTEMHVPFPQPDLVFGSLLGKWNEHSQVNIPEGILEVVDQYVAISSYKLETKKVRIKVGERRGGVGWITYKVLNDDQYWIKNLQTLAHFSLYSGVGISTTMGLGQCHVVTSQRSR